MIELRVRMPEAGKFAQTLAQAAAAVAGLRNAATVAPVTERAYALAREYNARPFAALSATGPAVDAGQGSLCAGDSTSHYHLPQLSEDDRTRFMGKTALQLFRFHGEGA
jgi:hypothetical protein